MLVTKVRDESAPSESSSDDDQIPLQEESQVACYGTTVRKAGQTLTISFINETTDIMFYYIMVSYIILLSRIIIQRLLHSQMMMIEMHL